LFKELLIFISCCKTLGRGYVSAIQAQETAFLRNVRVCIKLHKIKNKGIWKEQNIYSVNEWITTKKND
jgi:hypothetical protein